MVYRDTLSRLATVSGLKMVTEPEAPSATTPALHGKRAMLECRQYGET